MTWQPAAILPPDVELRFATDLRALLAAEGQSDVWVGRTIPSTRPKRIAQITSDGSPTNNLRTVARLRVNVWDTTDQKVTDLARLIVALVPRMVGANGVLWTVHQSGPYEITDAAGPRRFLLFEIHYRGELLA